MTANNQGNSIGIKNRTLNGYRKLGKHLFPTDWQELQLKDLLVEIKRPLNMEDLQEYELVTVKRNYGGIVSRGILQGNKIEVKSQFIVEEGDFLISKRQIAHGACGIVPQNLDGAIVSNEYNVLKNQKCLDLSFFQWYVQLPYMRRLFFIMSDGVHIEKLLFKLDSWLKKKVIIPKIEEQQQIARILSTWSKAIHLKEELLLEKKNQKMGLMENLLNGKRRLPGYVQKWKEVKLGEILKERKEVGYSHLELLAITSKNGVVRRTEVDIRDNSSEDKSKYKRIQPLDIGYNTMRMWQGVSGVSQYEGIVSPAYTILSPTSKIDSYFIGYLFKLPKIINLFRRYSQGLVNDTLNLKYENLKGIKVFIPQDIKEQKAITDILVTMDTEIKGLEREIVELKYQQVGLMQNLLTGKVRVKC